MLTALFSACVADTLSVVRTQAFFESSPAERRERLEQACLPRAIRGYAEGVSADVFMTDIKALFPLLTSAKGIPGRLLESAQETQFESYKLEIPGSAPAKEAGRTGTGMDVARVELSAEFLSDMNELLREIVHETAAEPRSNGFVVAFCGVLSDEVAEALDTETAEETRLGVQLAKALEVVCRAQRTIELGREIQSFLQTQIGVVSPLIQSPYPLSVQQKQEVRASLRERYPGSFPLFETEASLGGGIRLFYKGELFDESWMTQMTKMLATFQTDRSNT